MKKNNKKIELSLLTELVLSLLIMVIGIIVMIFKSFGLIDIILYISILFYILAFISVITYFIKRKEGDYEILLLALISVITATFLFVFKNDKIPMILGIGMTIFTILEVANRIYKIVTLKNENNFMWLVKFIITFVIGVLGLLTTINLFKEISVQTMMIAYYFITLGFLLSIESFIELFITDKKFKQILAKLLDDDPYKNLENIKENRIKEINDKNKKTKSVKSKTKKATINKENIDNKK